uniref:Putative F-box protein n=1 Tax=Noccaea caerulescens TaxID=107243 RepID=A0A1J3CMP3_NOCCA
MLHRSLLKSATKKKEELPGKLPMKCDIPRDLAEELLSRLTVTSLRGFRSACEKCNTLSKDRSFTKKPLAKLTLMSELPRDLLEEILSRLPVTSLRGFRSVCKKWNTLSKARSFTKQHIAQTKAAAAREPMVVMVIDCQVYLMGLDLHGIHKGVDPFINPQGKLITLDDSDRVDISQVYHCDGLLLCITKDFARFVVWNPYSGQTLWPTPRVLRPRLNLYRYAIGYENSNSRRNYKVLRYEDDSTKGVRFAEYEIYDCNSNTWRVLDVTSDWETEFYARGVSVKGNTYWFAQEKYYGVYDLADFLICFDFTRERFGPRLPLPFHSKIEDTVTLSSVGEDQLAVLFQHWDTLHMEIWVTTKIEPEVALWSKVFLSVAMKPLTDFTNVSFFIDQEMKVAVVLDKDKHVNNPTRNGAYIIGEDGYYREVDLGESTEEFHYPLGCSYVPSSVQIKQGGKKEEL